MPEAANAKDFPRKAPQESQKQRELDTRSALFDSKGRVRRDHVMIEGRDEAHSEGSYYLEWWDGGKRYREGAGPNAFAAAEKVRVKQAALTAVRSGIIPPPATVELVPQRTMLSAALDGYKDFVQYHRT